MSGLGVAVGTLSAAQVTDVLDAARNAPRLLRVRPWRLHCTATTVELTIERPIGSWPRPNDARAQVVACGAALLNLRLAIRSFGIEPVVHLWPDPTRTTLVAALEIDGERPSTADGLELLAAVGMLRTQIRRFRPGRLPADVIVGIRHAARAEQAWAALLPAAALAELSTLGSAAQGAQLAHSTVDAFVIGTVFDDDLSRLHAGQALQRTLLTAATFDFGASFMIVSLGSPAVRARLRGVVGGGLWPQAVVQIGRTDG